jgi:acyl phosphate:glycerol-3-phosphate acyltransferase
MRVLLDASVLAGSYIIGAIPFGLIIVKIMTGKDIRSVASGRTGGTNAMRAAGPIAGLFTAALDIFKAAGTVWLARALTGNVWVETLAPLAAILGNNYSVFLIERGTDGRLHLRGGAGGAAAGGGTFGLWAPAGLILVPSALLVWYLTGYASITTLSVGLLAIIIMGVRAALGFGPWEYVLYGVVTEVMLIWALRPNIKRLMDGTERRHGLPVLLQKRRENRLKEKLGASKDQE